LWAFERETALAIDLVQPIVGEEREKVAGDAQAVVGLRIAVDRLGAEDAIDLGLKPGRRVLTDGQQDPQDA